MRVFVGLGEGIGNVVMGLPLVDALHAAGHEVDLDIRPTPLSITGDLAELVCYGREWISNVFGQEGSDLCTRKESDRYDAACLTYWWISRGGPLPKAKETFVGRPPSDEPEILANLAAAGDLVKDPSPRAVLHLVSGLGRPLQMVAIHPGCKPDPEWKRRKVYPRWAEVTHRIKDAGRRVQILGTATDDAYCGEPQYDFRCDGSTILTTAASIFGSRCLVSGDSGLHHIAVALGVPTVVLFGESSVGKATHPDPIVKPVVLGPGFDSISPREVAFYATRETER